MCALQAAPLHPHPGSCRGCTYVHPPPRLLQGVHPGVCTPGCLPPGVHTQYMYTSMYQCTLPKQWWPETGAATAATVRGRTCCVQALPHKFHSSLHSVMSATPKQNLRAPVSHVYARQGDVMDGARHWNAPRSRTAGPEPRPHGKSASPRFQFTPPGGPKGGNVSVPVHATRSTRSPRTVPLPLHRSHV